MKPLFQSLSNFYFVLFYSQDNENKAVMVRQRDDKSRECCNIDANL